MKDRLLKFLEEESLTAAKFADEIGVQRSSISHILSGRNNPGYDFFQKVLKRYPHLNAEWLLMGSGKMTKTAQQASLFTVEPGDIDELQTKNKDKPDSATIKSGSGFGSEFQKESSAADSITETTHVKNIEKIVILYNDKSFKEYIPSK